VSRTQQGHERLAEEIAREKAAALGRAGERLEAALEGVHALARQIEASADPGARLLAEYERAHARAREARLALVIQREAIGLRQHRVVEQQFPEPPRRPGAARSVAR
jgi:hypothetical protein